ncbi:galactosyldiacylglycerol synthase [Advenella sp. S44]|uniref:glycosyltransferase n=1 Tax=Advenella sp. S44 TaxID=1982755 RepID=UPI000C2AF4C1|nr:glycosyltransferase [Advenella sp. S44]PJX25928.1 galactosyldiacylglycerol synthase [Advenella sp. S44]
MKKNIDLIYFNAGGGHRASARALEAVLKNSHPQWNVRLVNLFEVLDSRQVYKRVTGVAPEEFYNRQLAKGWTMAMTPELRILQAFIRLTHQVMVKRLQEHWIETEPAMVVSLVPNFNRAMYESLVSSLPGVPYVTILTDLADNAPNFWIEKNQQQHFICGTDKAVEQACAAGHPQSHVHPSSGMLLHPDFYKKPEIDRREQLITAGFDPDKPVGLVMFGGHGSKAMIKIAKQLSDVQMIYICGHNAALAKKIGKMQTRAHKLVEGFTTQMPIFMEMADFFIGKPGPGSISEAIRKDMPVIIVCNKWTMIQERYNGEWVTKNGLGIVLPSFAKINEAVHELLDNLDSFRARVKEQDNRAVFEVPDILENILQQSEAAPPLPLSDPRTAS